VTRHASTSKGLGIEDEELVAVIGSHAYFINSDVRFIRFTNSIVSPYFAVC
jgi:hypothetical protein